MRGHGVEAKSSEADAGKQHVGCGLLPVALVSKLVAEDEEAGTGSCRAKSHLHDHCAWPMRVHRTGRSGVKGGGAICGVGADPFGAVALVHVGTL